MIGVLQDEPELLSTAVRPGPTRWQSPGMDFFESVASGLLVALVLGLTRRGLARRHRPAPPAHPAAARVRPARRTAAGSR